jgi:hypothetical protein
MRSLSGPKAPEKEADPIIVHPAVRNMLLTQKAFAEGGRALVYLLSQYADIVEQGATEEERKFADNILSLLTPIAKAFLLKQVQNLPNTAFKYLVVMALFLSMVWNKSFVIHVLLAYTKVQLKFKHLIC